jgi:colicin import membrane protein
MAKKKTKVIGKLKKKPTAKKSTTLKKDKKIVVKKVSAKKKVSPKKVVKKVAPKKKIAPKKIIALKKKVASKKIAALKKKIVTKKVAALKKKIVTKKVVAPKKKIAPKKAAASKKKIATKKVVVKKTISPKKKAAVKKVPDWLQKLNEQEPYSSGIAIPIFDWENFEGIKREDPEKKKVDSAKEITPPALPKEIKKKNKETSITKTLSRNQLKKSSAKKKSSERETLLDATYSTNPATPKNTLPVDPKASQLAKAIVNAIEEKKGDNIICLDLRNIENRVCDYFIICDGNSTTQVDAIAGSVEF